MEKSTIRIVEDNKVIRDNGSKFISFHEEFDVVAVHGSATSFLDLLLIDASFTTDILVLDIGLPGISGLEAIPMILVRTPELNLKMQNAKFKRHALWGR